MSTESKTVPSLSLSKKTKEVPKLLVKGLELYVSRLRERASKIEELTKLQKEEEGVILDEVKKERISAEKNNQFYKCCLVLGQDKEQPVRVQFSNRFSKINIENEKVLQDCLGDLYPELFSKKINYKIRDDANLEVLQHLLGDKFEVFFQTEEYLMPCDMEVRAKLRQKLNATTNGVVDQLREQVSTKPGVSYRG